MISLQIGLLLAAACLGWICAFNDNFRIFALVFGIIYLFLFGSPAVDSFLAHLPDGSLEYESAGTFPMLPSTIGALRYGLKYLPLATIGVPFTFVMTIEGTRFFYLASGRPLRTRIKSE